MIRRAILAVLSFLFLLQCSTGAEAQTTTASTHANRPVRSLRVVLYPFIPNFPVAAEYVKNKYEASHPDVVLQVVDLSSNYYGSNDSNYVGDAAADVIELDSVFLRDFVAGNKIVPLPAEALLSSGELLKSADVGTTLDGKRFGAAHWICRDFLFFAKGDEPKSPIKTLSDLKSYIGSDKLLIDLRGKSTLGEYYLVAGLDRLHDFDLVYPDHIQKKPDPEIEADVLALSKLCNISSCRNPVLHSYTGTHSAEFARKQGKALLGYSEALNAVLTEIGNCPDPKTCVNANDIEVADPPLDDAGSTPMAWVDSFTLSAKCTGACVSDAVAFIRMMNEDDTYRALLFPGSLSFLAAPQPANPVPAYLLPAKTSLYEDPEIQKRAPIYKALKPLVDNALVPTALNLNDSLRAIGKQIDKDLP